MKKIVIRVHMNCEKCKGKVMQIAAKKQGVKSVAIVGDISDGKIMVIEKGVDSVKLTIALRKKLGRSANIETVEDVKEEKNTKVVKPKVECCPCPTPYQYYQHHPQSYYCVPADIPGDVAYPNNTCSIL